MNSSENIFVIDIQGFTDDFGALIPKEVAWTLLNGTAEMHAIISPPCSWDLLSAKSQIVNNYITNEKLGIAWTQRGITHDRMAALCTHVPLEVTTVYTYHHKARSLLHLFEHQKVICLCERLPQLDHLDINNDNCHFHQQLQQKFVCARENVKRMREYLLSIHCPSPENMSLTVYSPKTRSPSADVDYIKSPGFITTEPRMLSYFLWHSKIIEPAELSAAGLFYTGRNDETECFACRIKISLWLPGDNPYHRHQKANPQCILTNNDSLRSVFSATGTLLKKNDPKN